MIERWCFAPVALGRIAVLRTLAYLFVPLDVFLITPWALAHRDVPPALYQPLRVARVLDLPSPTHALIVVLCVALVGTALAAATGRAPRVLGTLVAVLYLAWMLVAMSYGKVDHDRVSYLVLLAVLPTVGPARWGDRTLSARAGWAVKATAIAVVCTYFLASWAKFRFGGIDWLTGATYTKAVLRRGTIFSDWTVHVPYLLVLAQIGTIVFELGSPVLLFLRGRWLTYGVLFLFGFHAMVYAGLTIAFWPHLVALAALLPLENLRVPRRSREPAPT
ncbi:MFS transporter permease [Cryptosporangium phraense]|uniref:MFS transporter permease n=1 Tax=Cryptosporangium phraense TaxID=2593070 RepID=A0A545AZA3_9ACTN|nr:MFS transporter permease [Cryptosporangium phraense]TQS46656.1 MFS transporter permease [Cryptosporangium phraense]